MRPLTQWRSLALFGAHWITQNCWTEQGEKLWVKHQVIVFKTWILVMKHLVIILENNLIPAWICLRVCGAVCIIFALAGDADRLVDFLSELALSIDHCVSSTCMFFPWLKTWCRDRAAVCHTVGVHRPPRSKEIRRWLNVLDLPLTGF